RGGIDLEQAGAVLRRGVERGGDAGCARGDAGGAGVVAHLRVDQAVGGQVGGVGDPRDEDLPERLNAVLRKPAIGTVRRRRAWIINAGRVVVRDEDGGCGRVVVVGIGQQVQGPLGSIVHRRRVVDL